jgi:CheY-like chemotaxis protein/GNAT superfamily N-acetyltransferase
MPTNLAVQSHDHKTANGQAMNPLNILIVEDDIPIQQLIVGHFERTGWQVRSADCGRSALKALEQQNFDVILSDIRMPDINGIEMLRTIRSKGNPVPVVFLSANDDPEIVIEARRLGAFEYLEKPADMDDVTNVLKRAAEKRLAPEPVNVGLNYELDWATAGEVNWIHSEMVKLNRQTMNFRMMPEARFLRFKDLDRDKIVGWGGLTDKGRFPEVFSLYVDPEYRGFGFGRVIELARHHHFHEMGIKHAYGRMTVNTNLKLLNYRVNNKLFEPIDEHELDRDYADLCKQCELYRVKCMDQKYFRIDVENFIKLNTARMILAGIGAVDAHAMPVKYKFTREALLKNARKSV